MGAKLSNVDFELLSAWILEGVELFRGDRLPVPHEAIDAARRVVLKVMVQRYGGNITHVAAVLRTSRRAVRDQLKRFGLYEETTAPESTDEAETEGKDLGLDQSDGLGDEEPVREPDDEHEHEHQDQDTHPIRVDDDGEE